jgi:hypothetical protein
MALATLACVRSGVKAGREGARLLRTANPRPLCYASNVGYWAQKTRLKFGLPIIDPFLRLLKESVLGRVHARHLKVSFWTLNPCPIELVQLPARCQSNVAECQDTLCLRDYF